MLHDHSCHSTTHRAVCFRCMESRSAPTCTPHVTTSHGPTRVVSRRQVPCRSKVMQTERKSWQGAVTLERCYPSSWCTPVLAPFSWSPGDCTHFHPPAAAARSEEGRTCLTYIRVRKSGTWKKNNPKYQRRAVSSGQLAQASATAVTDSVQAPEVHQPGTRPPKCSSRPPFSNQPKGRKELREDTRGAD